VPLEVPLVVGLRRVVVGQRRQLGDDRAIEDVAAGKLVDQGLSLGRCVSSTKR
jgi:hypothetical protein